MKLDSAYPPVVCSLHPSSWLLDVKELGGNLTAQCSICHLEAGDSLVCINVVRGIHVRASDIAAGKKASGQ